MQDFHREDLSAKQPLNSSPQSDDRTVSLKNDLIAIKKKAVKRGLLKYLHPSSARTPPELSQQDFAMDCLAA